MVKRTKIGLLFTYDENWIGGTYYIVNLIHALKRLPESKQFFLNIYVSDLKHYQSQIAPINYSFIKPILIKRNSRLVTKIKSILARFNVSMPSMLKADCDLIFPNPDIGMAVSHKKELYWIPDFQEKYYPKFFTEQQINARRIIYNYWVIKKKPIVFSSKSALNDFNELYPLAKNSTYVMPFAVTLPDISAINAEKVLERFGIKKPYFICSNQFWKHKNHMVVLKAIKILKEQGQNSKIVFTGKPNDFRNPLFYSQLLDYVDKNDLNNEVIFLGFIDRTDQLILMKNSKAIIQPSLFEGWSTVVEDAKALNHPIIVSDLPVHREQLENYAYFFLPDNEVELSVLMKTLSIESLEQMGNYTIEIQNFATKFHDIVNHELTV
jgi:glycosyltransferase involved in cell wall biosynthesis